MYTVQRSFSLTGVDTQYKVPIKTMGDFWSTVIQFLQRKLISCNPETFLFINTAYVTMTTDRQKLLASAQGHKC